MEPRSPVSGSRELRLKACITTSGLFNFSCLKLNEDLPQKNKIIIIGPRVEDIYARGSVSTVILKNVELK